MGKQGQMKVFIIVGLILLIAMAFLLYAKNVMG